MNEAEISKTKMVIAKVNAAMASKNKVIIRE